MWQKFISIHVQYSQLDKSLWYLCHRCITVLSDTDISFQGVEPIWLEKGLFWLETQQDGGKKRQISTPVSAFSTIVGVSLKFVRFGNLIISYDNVCLF